MYMHTTNFNKAEPAGTSGLPGHFVRYTAGDPKHKNYFCAINVPPGRYAELRAKLTRLLTNVGPTSQATAITTLIVTGPPSGDSVNFTTPSAQVDLVLWDATWLGEITVPARGALFTGTDFSCIDADNPAPSPQAAIP